MIRREFITLLGGAATWPLAARAQQAGSGYTIGTLTAGNDNAALNTVLIAALRELGWVEGKNVVFEHRYADNRLERLPGLAVSTQLRHGRLKTFAAQKHCSLRR